MLHNLKKRNILYGKIWQNHNPQYSWEILIHLFLVVDILVRIVSTNINIISVTKLTCLILFLLFTCQVVSDSSATPWTVARQVPLFMGFPRQEYWSGLPFPSPAHLPNPGIEPATPTLKRRFFTWAIWEAHAWLTVHINNTKFSNFRIRMCIFSNSQRLLRKMNNILNHWASTNYKGLAFTLTSS